MIPRLDLGEFRRAEVLLAQQPEDRAGRHGRHEAAPLVHPLSLGRHAIGPRSEAAP